MINFLKKYFVLIVLVLLVIILIVLKIFYGSSDANKTAVDITPTQTPNMIPTKVEYEVDNPNIEKNETIALPFMGKKMQIVGYLKPGVLEVVVEKEEDKKAAEIEVDEWLKKYPNFKSNTFEYVVRKTN